MMSNELDRRDFLKTATAAGVGLGMGAASLSACAPTGEASMVDRGTEPLDRVRVGYVGLGHQGPSHVRNLLAIEGVEIRALCDLLPERVDRVAGWVTEAGQAPPVKYSGGEEEFRRMCEQEDLDLVYNAAPWKWHVPICVAAMENGKHAATEIPAAITLDDCWQMVEVSEKTGKQCVPMENCCYDRTELMILNMVRKGVLGELLYAECGYDHDLRELKLSDYYVNRWRIEHSKVNNGDLYPTHGLGPVSQWMGINRGNRFDTLVSMATKSRGLNLYAAEKYGPDSPEATQRYALGDIVTTLLRTRNGETVLILHNTDSPRPYSRKIMLQGTKGLVRKYPEQKIYVEGRSPNDRWEELAEWIEEYEHPLWKAMEERSRGASHGGMDFIEDYRLIQNLREGKPMDADVYDAATWGAVIELSIRSIARGSVPMAFPDFTRGAWQGREPLGIVTI